MQFGLIAAGRVNGSFIARLPRLESRLGPVVARSYRLASRIVNTLGAGHPERDWHSLARVRTVLICVEPGDVAYVSEQLAASSIDWSAKLVLLCDSGSNSTALSHLAGAGAAVASLNPLPGLEARWFVIEGDRAAARHARRFVQELRAAAVEVDPGSLGLFEAGLWFASGLFTPLLEACGTCLRDAGLTPRAATRLAKALFQQTLRGYLHARRKTSLAQADEARIAALARALRHSNPAVAEYYRRSVANARKLTQRGPASLPSPD